MRHALQTAAATLAAALAATALTGCGDMDLDKRSELVEYRVLAVSADVPQPSPQDTVTLTVVDHVPQGAEPGAADGDTFYMWEVCPLSFGALTNYECFDPFDALGGADATMGSADMLPPEIAARLPDLIERLVELGVSREQVPYAFAPQYFATDGPSLTLDMAALGGVGVEALLAMCSAFSPDGVCRTRGREPVTLEQGWDVWVKLYSGVRGVRRVDTVKVLKVRDFEGRNTANPVIEAVNFEDPDGGSASLTPESVIQLVPSIAAGSAEEYPDILIDSEGAIRRGTDGAVLTESATEDLVVSWYATAGEFEFTRTTSDDLKNELTLPDEPGPVRIWVVVRDGRGGFAVWEDTIEVSE